MQYLQFPTLTTPTHPQTRVKKVLELLQKRTLNEEKERNNRADFILMVNAEVSAQMEIKKQQNVAGI